MCYCIYPGVAVAAVIIVDLDQKIGVVVLVAILTGPVHVHAVVQNHGLHQQVVVVVLAAMAIMTNLVQDQDHVPVLALIRNLQNETEMLHPRIKCFRLGTHL